MATQSPSDSETRSLDELLNDLLARLAGADEYAWRVVFALHGEAAAPVTAESITDDLDGLRDHLTWVQWCFDEINVRLGPLRPQRRNRLAHNETQTGETPC